MPQRCHEAGQEKTTGFASREHLSAGYFAMPGTRHITEPDLLRYSAGHTQIYARLYRRIFAAAPGQESPHERCPALVIFACS